MSTTRRKLARIALAGMTVTTAVVSVARPNTPAAGAMKIATAVGYAAYFLAR